MTRHDDGRAEQVAAEMVETCLVCLVAWDTEHDPPKCSEPSHPHALAMLADWNEVGKGCGE